MDMALSLLVVTLAQCENKKGGRFYDVPLSRIVLFFRCHLIPACVMCSADNGQR